MKNCKEKFQQDIPVVSIILPTYNFADKITPTIESILNQTYSNFELIIVDDGSTDNTSNIIQSFKDSRIRYYWEENSGGASARNFGIQKAKGEYIAFCDHDDLWLPTKLTTQVNFMQKNLEICLSLVGSSVENDKGEEIMSFVQKSEIPLKDILLKEKPITFSQMVFGAKALKELGPLNTSYKLCDDYDILVRAIRKIKIGYIPKKLVRSIKHSVSASQDSLQLSREINRVKLDHLSTIVKDDPRLTTKDRQKIKTETYFREAKCAYFTNQRWTAAKNFIKSIIASPTNYQAYLFLPFCLFSNKFFERLVPLYEKIMRRKYVKYF